MKYLETIHIVYYRQYPMFIVYFILQSENITFIYQGIALTHFGNYQIFTILYCGNSVLAISCFILKL